MNSGVRMVGLSVEQELLIWACCHIIYISVCGFTWTPTIGGYERNQDWCHGTTEKRSRCFGLPIPSSVPRHQGNTPRAHRRKLPENMTYMWNNPHSLAGFRGVRRQESGVTSTSYVSSSEALPQRSSKK